MQESDTAASRVSVIQEKWDYLIVLDACRYDYFKRSYKDYLQGTLKKRISVGTGTSEWRDKSFPDYYDDIIYISANPYINSLTSVRSFCGKDHFNEVFDLWLEEWDEANGTVMPQSVTKRAKEIICEYPDKRAIIHYIQPHEPYIGGDAPGPGYKPPAAGGILQGLENEPWLLRKFMNLTSGVFYWLGIRGNKLIWDIRKFIGMPPAGPMDAVRRQYGDEVLRKAYEDNLKAALPYVAELIEHLSGRIIVTADHGEMLGKDGCYCHWSRADKKQLREIPWLIIDKGPKKKSSARQRESRENKQVKPEKIKDKLQQRLKNLGYS